MQLLVHYRTMERKNHATFSLLQRLRAAMARARARALLRGTCSRTEPFHHRP